jgi:hypothetical protein
MGFHSWVVSRQVTAQTSGKYKSKRIRIRCINQLKKAAELILNSDMSPSGLINY